MGNCSTISSTRGPKTATKNSVSKKQAELDSKPIVLFIVGSPLTNKPKYMSKLTGPPYYFTHISMSDMPHLQTQTPNPQTKNYNSPEDTPILNSLKSLEKLMIKSGWRCGKFLIENFPCNPQFFLIFSETLGKKTITPAILWLKTDSKALQGRFNKHISQTFQGD